MSPGGAEGAYPFARTVVRHSLGWMLAANGVGVWLAVSLLWPAVGDGLAPLTYGRWMPLHQNWQLYGWCALPLVGVLLAWCCDGRHPQVKQHGQLALAAWSLALALGGVAWLGGTTSGKLFLDWHGWTRLLLPAAMHVLWALLAAHTWWRWRELDRTGRWARALTLAVLALVPTVLYWAAGRDVHPAVNPGSGGATGAALLGSTLGIVTIYLALPQLLGLPRGQRGRRTWFTRTFDAVAEVVRFSRPGFDEMIPHSATTARGTGPAGRSVLDPLRSTSRRLSGSCRGYTFGHAFTVFKRGYTFGGGLEPRGVSSRSTPLVLGLALGASWLVFALIDHGHTSHHAAAQIAALAVLMLWIPLLPLGWAGYAWPGAARPWLGAAAGWWGLLVLSGWVTFLPGFSEALKFTHGLVAHAHLAMAGFVTSVNGAIVVVLTGRAVPRGVFGLWQVGGVIMIAAMFMLGGLEAERVDELYRSELWTQALLTLRLGGGVAMLVASARWWWGYFRA